MLYMIRSYFHLLELTDRAGESVRTRDRHGFNCSYGGGTCMLMKYEDVASSILWTLKRYFPRIPKPAMALRCCLSNDICNP